MTVVSYVNRMMVFSNLLSYGFIPTMDIHCLLVSTDSVFMAIDRIASWADRVMQFHSLLTDMQPVWSGLQLDQFSCFVLLL